MIFDLKKIDFFLDFHLDLSYCISKGGRMTKKSNTSVWGGHRDGAGRKTSDPAIQKSIVLPQSLWNMLEALDKDSKPQRTIKRILDQYILNQFNQQENNILETSDETEELSKDYKCVIKSKDDEIYFTERLINLIFDGIAPFFMNAKAQAEKEQNNQYISRLALSLGCLLEAIDPDKYKHTFAPSKINDKYEEEFIEAKVVRKK